MRLVLVLAGQTANSQKQAADNNLLVSKQPAGQPLYRLWWCVLAAYYNVYNRVNRHARTVPMQPTNYVLIELECALRGNGSVAVCPHFAVSQNTGTRQTGLFVVCRGGRHGKTKAHGKMFVCRVLASKTHGKLNTHGKPKYLLCALIAAHGKSFRNFLILHSILFWCLYIFRGTLN